MHQHQLRNTQIIFFTKEFVDLEACVKGHVATYTEGIWSREGMLSLSNECVKISTTPHARRAQSEIPTWGRGWACS